MADTDKTSAKAAVMALQTDEDFTKSSDAIVVEIENQPTSKGQINWVKYGAFTIFSVAWFCMVGVLGYHLGHPGKWGN